MGCLKRIVGFGIFLVGLFGCLFYFPVTLLSLDPSAGGRLMNLVLKFIPALTNTYNEQAAQIFWGSGNYVMMMLASIGVLILGLWIAK